MFRSVMEAADKTWFFYEAFTLLSNYKAFQKRIVDVYAPYRYIATRYSRKANRNVFPVTEEYLQEHPEIAIQNVALLRNSMDLWRAASRVSDAVSPVLYHYSWHCLNSFLAYTFFRWDPQHTNSHGIRISWSSKIETIRIEFHKKPGLFQRFIDTWTLLGLSLVFSKFIPVFEGERIDFEPYDRYLPGETDALSLRQLWSFDPYADEREFWKRHGRENLLSNRSIGFWGGWPSDIMQSYLTVFAASNVARYRPALWQSVLVGEKPEQTLFAVRMRDALLRYTQHGINSNSLLDRMSHLFKDIMIGRLELKSLSP